MKKIVSLLLVALFIVSILPTGVFGAQITEYKNIALGCSYTTSQSANSSYPDAGEEMTDGEVGSKSYSDKKWAGWCHAPVGTYVNVIIDLGAKKEFQAVELVTLNSATNGGINYPQGDIKISYSDSENKGYTEFYTGPVPEDAPQNAVYTYKTGDLTPVEGRYVKIEFYANKWSFFSEMRVMADAPVEPKLPEITKDLEKELDVNEGDTLTLSVNAKTSDNGTLSYQWYKDGVAIDGAVADTYEKTASTEDTGSYYLEITNSYNGFEKTITTASCDVVVYPAGFSVAKPVFDKNLSSTINLNYRDTLTLDVDVSVTDSGTLSYQWYKDGVVVGENSDSYVIDSVKVADGGTYKVVVTNTVDGLYKKEAESAQCTVTVNENSPSNILSGVKYTTSVADSEFHGSYKDANRSKLTDGKKTTAWDNVNNVGFKKRTDGVDITFDFGEEKSFKEIHLYSYNPGNSGIASPKNVKIEAKISGEWKYIFNSTVTPSDKGKLKYVFAVPDDVAFKAEEVRFTLNSFETWLFMDEIEIFDDTTGLDTVGTLKIVRENNVALGKSYECVGSNAPEDVWYPDTDNKELTDGQVASISYQNAAWVGRRVWSEFTFDLEDTYSFEEVRAVFLNSPSVAIRIPPVVELYVSDDKENWTQVASDYLLASTKDMILNYSLRVPDTAYGRYVKFAARDGGWIFISEVEILRTATENPDSYDNNIAARKSYTFNADTENEDTKASELTDGEFAAVDYLDAGWTGFEASSENTEIVFDLVKKSTLRQINTRFLNDTENGISVPATMNVFISDDNNIWTEIGLVEIPSLDTENAVASVYKYLLPQEKSAKYVKLSFPTENKVYIDEIEILEKQNFFETEAEESYIDKNNIAYGMPYVISQEANALYPDTDNKELTDAERATHLYSDERWAGFDAITYEEEAKDGSFYTKYRDFVVTVDLGEVKEFEHAQIGALKSSSQKYQVVLPETVKVEYSQDGTHWNLFAETENSEDLGGVNRFNLMLDEKVSAQFVRFTLAVTGPFFIDEIAIYENKMVNGDYESNPDEGDTYNLVLNSDYKISRSADYRSTYGILTDGVYAQDYSKYDAHWTGFLKNEDKLLNSIELIFEMENVNSVKEVVFSSRNDDQNNLTTPKKIKLYSSIDGVYYDEFGTIEDITTEGNVELKWLGADGFDSEVEGATEVYVKYLKIVFETPNSDAYACLDEIKVIGKRGKTSTGSFPVSAVGFGNLALGKSYESIPVQKNDQWDENGKKLTDGIKGSLSSEDPAWCLYVDGYKTDPNNATTKTVLQTFIVDLEKEQYVTEVNMRTYTAALGNQGPAEHPWTVFTYASNDGENWFMLSRQWDVNRVFPSKANAATHGWRSGISNIYGESDTIPEYSSVKARYIRIDVELLRNCLIDEIEVYGYTVPQDNAYIITEGRNLDNARDYMVAGEQTGGIQDMILCYNGWYGLDSETKEPTGDWKAYQYRPALTYVDRDGNAVAPMFDAVCLLALKARSGRIFNTEVQYGKVEPTQAEDWYWYLDKTFREGGDVDELNKAAKIASEELGDPNYKIKLLIMHPSNDRIANKNFGPLDGEYYDTSASGYEYSMVEEEKLGWQKVADWWFKEVIERFEAGNYEYIDFAGFYYLSETVIYSHAITRYHVERCHELGYRMYWIPFEHADGLYWKDDIGFDAITIQPGHFFKSPYENGEKSELGNDYIDNIAKRANYLNTGIELEFEGYEVDRDPMKYNQFIDYLNGIVKNGMDGDKCYRNWYEGLRGVARCAYSEKAAPRALYDYMYQMMQGTYTPKSYITDLDTIPAELEDTDGEYGSLPGTPGFSGSQFAEGSGSASGGGGSYYKEPEKDLVETATPSKEGYTWFTGTNGYQLKDGNGELVKGWAEVNGDWYYLDANGYLKTGWVKDGNTWYYLRANGAMANSGWYKVDNVWYYFGATGAMKTGWVLDNGRWYYMASSGAMSKSTWVEVNGVWYYFTQSGAMATGWILDGNNWYYLSESGAMVTGWKAVKGEWYYLDPANGKMLSNTTVDGYKLGADGKWIA